MCPEGRGVARETERLLYCSTQPLKAGIGSCRMTLSRGFSPRGCNSVGRVPASQAGCRGFESLHPLSGKQQATGHKPVACCFPLSQGDFSRRGRSYIRKRQRKGRTVYLPWVLA